MALPDASATALLGCPVRQGETVGAKEAESEEMTCGRKIGIYNCCSVVCGDCLELMKAIPDGAVDAVITDPPYGIGIAANPFRQKFEASDWDDEPATEQHFDELRRVSKQQIVWGGNYFPLPPSQGFLIWDKGQVESFSSAMCEQAWMSQQRPAKMFRLFAPSFSKEHPTQKPEPLMQWCIQQAGMPETILDPFAGSGTTGVAAAKLGRHYLLFEISEEYCRIARERIARVEAQPSLFDKPAEQIPLDMAVKRDSK